MYVPLPPDEVQRLRVLRDYGILDTPPEIAFDRVAKLAVHLFDVPIAMVSLIDTERQWFKSCFGLNRRETKRELSFALMPSSMMT